ncbi:hypothetical protein WJX81_007090 [Elliptochloris bilobata]|uniref:5'-deoxynucleotidase n=1 Tax=Elliptochloris bilobata TaxID=381761 RepID=A0AAW1S271_9CHLO
MGDASALCVKQVKSVPSGTSAAQAIDFLMLLQNLKNTKRTGWVRSGVAGPESIADHMYRMGMMALVAGDAGVDTNRCIRLALVHDVAEAIVGDIAPSDNVSKEDKRRLEEDAVQQIHGMLGSAAGKEIEELFHEYEAGETHEARLVKDFDKVEMVLQAAEYEAAQGLALQPFFDSTAGRFQTATGRAWAAETLINVAQDRGQSAGLRRGEEAAHWAVKELVEKRAAAPLVMASTSGRERSMPVTELLGSVEASFHDEEYIVTLSVVGGSTLRVEVERKADGHRWSGDFPAQHVEEITARTGNYKKFAVFSRMLLAALRADSDAVAVDLLTYADLEALRARPATAGAGAPAHGASKRYLIMTYAVEYDRVHYPLPLAFEARPDPDRLRATVAGLRAELDAARLGCGGRRGMEAAAELRRLREQVAAQQAALAAAEAAAREAGAGRAAAEEALRDLRLVRQEGALLQKRAEAAEAELAAQRAAHRRDLRRSAKELAEAQEEAARLREAVRDLRVRCREAALDAEAARARRGGAFASAPRMAYSERGSPQVRPPAARLEPRAYSVRASAAPSRAASPRRPGVNPGEPWPSQPPSPGRPPRFDPTQYVHERRKREAAAAERCQRRPTPPPSRPSSGAPSPARNRPCSTERSREHYGDAFGEERCGGGGALRGRVCSQQGAEPSAPAGGEPFVA